METNPEAYDAAMFAFSQGDYDSAISQLEAILQENPADFDAQLSLGMAFHRKGDHSRAILEGHKAEQLRPNEQLVHTNLSLFYMRSGDKKTAEHHGLQARIASWRGNMTAPGAEAELSPEEKELQIARPSAPPAPTKIPEKFPDMPWKKQNRVGAQPVTPATSAPAASSIPVAPATAPPPGLFINAGPADRLAPGRGRSFVVGGREIAIYFVDGRYHAFDDACPHRGASLGAGHQEAGHVYCPLHGWKFDLATGACETNPERPLLMHEVTVREGDLWVRLAPVRPKNLDL